MRALAAARPEAGRFWVRYLGDMNGRVVERKAPLAHAHSVRFERVPPVREFPSYTGQRNFPGLWWSSTTQDLVGYESWLERDRVMLLDFSREVVAFSSQPFWLTWRAGAELRRHAPDYFARLADGSRLVIDVRADDDIGLRDAEAFAATGEACASIGWSYERVGAPDPVLVVNLRWLSDYKHPRTLDPACAATLRAALARPLALMDAARIAGDPMAVLPSLFHMLWSGSLQADLSTSPLSGSTLVQAAGEDR